MSTEQGATGYDYSGELLDGEYPVRAHLADDGKVFCSILDDGEPLFPRNIEQIEGLMYQAERHAFDGLVLDEWLTPEPERVEDAPVVGTAVFAAGRIVRTDFDGLAEVES